MSPARPHSPSQPNESVQSSAEFIGQRSLPTLHFQRWRPQYHLQAPSGWMNDPCAPGYDLATGRYHLFFQWNPRRNPSGAVTWANICWGHATSTDMIDWTVSATCSLTPGAWYDSEGCFTGCLRTTGLHGQSGQLTIFYTGVNRLPLHYTLPYIRTTETLAVAQSADGGESWTKLQENPVHSEPPVGMSVTGWRDPFVAPWPSMDKVRGHDGPRSTLYGMISGGIRDATPTAFLYSVNPTNLAQWTFLTALIDLGSNGHMPRWSGDMGVNWECANFMTLTNEEDGSSREFIIVGGEGSRTTMMHPKSECPQPLTKCPRAPRSMQWMCGKLYATLAGDRTVCPKMKYRYGSRFDHACLYGVNTFTDPQSSKQIAWGWVTEEDLPPTLVNRQNWSGMISLPRELSLICLKGVTGALRSKLQDISSIEIEPESEDTFVVRTLGIAPATAVEGLRRGTRELRVEGTPVLSPTADCFLDVQTCRFELSATFSVSDHCSRIGLSVFHTEDHDISSATTVSMTTATETLTVERPDSRQIDANINTFPETAPFTVFSVKRAGRREREHFQVRLWFDESVLEIFANSRCTFATRVYPSTKRCWGVRFWADDSSQQSRLLQARVWDGLRADIRVADGDKMSIRTA